MKRFALLMVVLTLLAPQAWALAASYEDADGPKDKKEKRTKGPQDKSEKQKNEPISVPEPATITLLAAGAGVVAARKLWRNRQR
jgi:PEP-CTERM motif